MNPENLVPHQFKPGDPRINRKGRHLGKSIRQLGREVAESKNRALIEKMYEKALKGDVKAAEWITKYLQDSGNTVTIERFSVEIAPPQGEAAEVTEGEDDEADKA